MDPNAKPYSPYSGTDSEKLRIYFDDYKEDYELVKEEAIGAGTYGSTRLVRNKRDSKVYAMKTMFSRYIGDLLSEIWIASRFKYVHIISVYEVYFKYVPDMIQQPSDIFTSRDTGRWRLDIIMERAYPIKVDDYTLQEKWKLIHQLITVLSFLQGYNVIYGDIKLDNLLMSSDGKLKLIDLGMYYKVGFGRAPITQSYSDLGGYHKQKKPIYKSPHDKSPRSIAYDVVKNAMWALGMTIIEILTGKYLDFKQNIEGVPLIVYEITDNPEYLTKILKGYEQWIPLVGSLLIKPPMRFTDILWTPIFKDLSTSYMSVISTSHVLEPTIPVPYLKDSPQLDKAFTFIYSIDKIKKLIDIGIKIEPEAKCMAGIYFMYYMLPLGFGLDSYMYKELKLSEELISYHMKMRFVNVRHYPDVYMPEIKTEVSKQKKMLLGIPIFSFACLVFGQAVISNEYETFNIEWIKVILEILFGSICPNTDILFSGVIYYLEGLIAFNSGNFVLPNPYFTLVQQNPNLQYDLEKLSKNYSEYAQFLYSYTESAPLDIFAVSDQRLPQLSDMIGELEL